MMRIDVRHDIRKLTEHLTRLQKEQIPFATSLALNRTAIAATRAVKSEMERVLHRPTRWTTSSYIVLQWSKKRSPTVIFGFKTRKVYNEAGKFTGRFTDFNPTDRSLAGVYLQPLMAGSARQPKNLELRLRAVGLLGANEFLVPSRFQPLDAHGNVSRGTIQKILANLRAARDPYTRTPRGGARGGRKKGEYFFTRKGVKGQRLTAIWKRGSESGVAVPAFIVVAGAPKYRKVLDHEATAMRTVQVQFPAEFVGAMNQALATSRR